MPSYDTIMQLPYKDFLEEVFIGAPKNCTWMEVRDWLMTKYSPIQITYMYIKLYKQLVQFTPDGQEEDSEADSLRDDMDVFYFASDLEELKNIDWVNLPDKNYWPRG